MKNKINSLLPLLMILIMALAGFGLARFTQRDLSADPAATEMPGVADPDSAADAPVAAEPEPERRPVSYPLAILGGAFIGYPLGQAMAGFLRGNRRWRWVAMTVLMIYVFTVSVIWGAHAALAAFPAVILTFIFTAIMLRELYNGDVMKTIGQHLRLTFGYFKGFQIVNQGKMIVPTEKGPIMGPRIFVVRPGNAW